MPVGGQWSGVWWTGRVPVWRTVDVLFRSFSQAGLECDHGGVSAPGDERPVMTPRMKRGLEMSSREAELEKAPEGDCR